ncbi:hypothetical protein [Paraburkholderia sp. GAS42]|jgi:hypothetical protein|uniref:hypothetical protein n=1 Tax=Paraburkholderia sp. GAS42 TaxID=3035135 RepID=UPI003D1E5587
MSVQAINHEAMQAAGSTAPATTTKTAEATAATSTSSKPAGAATAPMSYSVSISQAGRAMLAEATETSVQTAQEAGAGDRQAQRLLAKEAAAKAG